jgi:hypothetical protein
MGKIYHLCYPEVRSVTTAQIEAGYSDAIANGDIVGNNTTLIYLTTDEKAAALQHAGKITLVNGTS